MIEYMIPGIIFLLIFLFWLSGFFSGAPFQPSSDRAMKKMIMLSGVKKGDKVAELGSGNGKLVVEFAKHGAKVTGFEINPILVWISRRKIKKFGLQERAKIKWKSFWDADLSEFDIISIFQINYVMRELEGKFKDKIKGKRIVSNTWKFKTIKPKKRDGHVFLYKF